MRKSVALSVGLLGPVLLSAAFGSAVSSLSEVQSTHATEIGRREIVMQTLEQSAYDKRLCKRALKELRGPYIIDSERHHIFWSRPSTPHHYMDALNNARDACSPSAPPKDPFPNVFGGPRYA